MANNELVVQSLKRAVMTLRSRVEQSPKDVATACALAEALFRLATRTQEPARQLEYLTRACQLDSYDARLRIALGRARVRTGDLRGGAEAFGAAAALRPGDPGPWLALGNALVAHYRAVPEAKAKIIDRALESYDRALAIDPSLQLVHAAKLFAAACARVPGRPVKLLPAEIQTIAPTATLASAVTWLSLGLAYAIHFPKHVGTRNVKERITPEERKAKTQAFRALAAALEPWIAALPDARSLAMVKAAIEIFDAELPTSDDGNAAARGEAFAKRVIEVAPRFTDRWLLHLVVHQKLEEIVDPGLRIEVMRAITKNVPLAVGMERDLFGALNAAARAALLDGRVADAQRHWRDGLAIDRYCVAFHHNLALVALHQRDAAHLALHLEASLDLQLGHWCIAGERTELLERVAAQHAAFASRMSKTVAAELARAECDVDPDLLASWIGETQIGLVLQAVLCALLRGAAPGATLRGMVASYLRDQPVIGDPAGQVSAELLDLLDPITRQPPLLYEVLEIASDASRVEIAAAAERAVEAASTAVAQALGRGDPQRVRRALARLARVKEAKETLEDETKRAAYDQTCMSTVEHNYNKARYRFILDLANYAGKLARKERHDLVRVLARAYRQLPHDRIDAYFDPDERETIREHMLGCASRLGHMQVLMERERHEEAYQVADQALALLESWRSVRGDAQPHVHYFIAVFEFHRELAFVRSHGVLSAAGVTVQTHAAELLEKLGGPSHDDEDKEN